MALTDKGTAPAAINEQRATPAEPAVDAKTTAKRRAGTPAVTGPATDERAAVAVPVSASESESADARPTPRPWVPWLRRGLALLWVAGVAVFLVEDGIPVDRETIIGLTVPGLLIWSIGRRSLGSVFIDWVPFVAVLLIYDYTRGLAQVIGAPTQWIWQIDSDRFLGGGTIPTVWLQEHLKVSKPPPWEVGVSLVYISFYFVPYLVAGYLWLRSRTDFRQFVVRFVGLSFIGVVIFIAMPASPPWAAAQCQPADVVSHPADPSCLDELNPMGAPNNGLLGPYNSVHLDPATSVERISSRGFASLHLPNAQELLSKGQASVNLVAAIPSLHAATTLMLSMFLWPRVRKRWRPLLILYPPAMAFTLVYSAEHYLTDILIGWALALALELGVRQVIAWRRRRRRPNAEVHATRASSTAEVRDPT